mmetsp:Transcript_16037/g.34715  ORF Transcript_16037/g.34715 Transcript_16037/m.34715 type:complete len:140 (-) Transcript_16037:114-533(-)
MVIAATMRPLEREKRSVRSSGSVRMRRRRMRGPKMYPSMNATNIDASHSNMATGSPEDAPEPARPTKCSEPMLDMKSEHPTPTHGIERPARKKRSAESGLVVVVVCSRGDSVVRGECDVVWLGGWGVLDGEFGDEGREL